MRSSLGRNVMPLGRPLDTPNLVKVKTLTEGFIDQKKVEEGIDKLGHHRTNTEIPNMKQTTARGLSFYCQTEEVMNILRENERIDDESMVMKYGDNWKEEMAT